MRSKLFFVASLCLCVSLLLPMFFVCSPLASLSEPKQISQTFSQEITKVKVISNKISAFKLADENSEIMTTFYYGQILEVINQNEKFYEILFNNTNAFVLKAYCISCDIKNQTIYIKTDAKILEKAQVYILQNGEIISQEMFIEKDHKVKLTNGYDEKQEFTQITYQYENGEILNCYVKTINVLPDSITERSLVAIMIIIVCISIFLILYSFIKGKKKKQA